MCSLQRGSSDGKRRSGGGKACLLPALPTCTRPAGPVRPGPSLSKPSLTAPAFFLCRRVRQGGPDRLSGDLACHAVREPVAVKWRVQRSLRPLLRPQRLQLAASEPALQPAVSALPRLLSVMPSEAPRSDVWHSKEALMSAQRGLWCWQDSSMYRAWQSRCSVKSKTQPSFLTPSVLSQQRSPGWCESALGPASGSRLRASHASGRQKRGLLSCAPSRKT